MKKFVFLPIAALAIGLAACDANDDSKGIPVVNPELAAFSPDDLTLVATDASQAIINLGELNNAGEEVQICRPEAKNWPTGYEYSAVMQLSKTEDFANYAEIPVTVSPDTVFCVSPAAWEEAYVTTISKNPKAQDIYIRFAVSAKKTSGKATEQIRLGGENRYYGTAKVNVLPYPTDYFVAEKYNFNIIYTDGTTETVAFIHDDTDVYDNPEFKALVNLNGDFSWTISVAQEPTSSNMIVYFPAETNAQNGKLVINEGSAGQLEGFYGPHMVSVNMETLDYSITLAIEELYTPGGSNGWDQLKSQRLTTTDYISYHGMAHLDGEFKFTSAPDWNGVNYGSTGVEGELTSDGGAGNINAGENGLYWAYVNLVDMKYTLTPVKTVGAIGAFNEWSASVNFTPSEDFLVWTGEVTFTAPSTEWKIRCNDGWDLSFGGNPDELGWDNAPNLTSPAEAGTYIVTVNFSDIYYTVECKKK